MHFTCMHVHGIVAIVACPEVAARNKSRYARASKCFQISEHLQWISVCVCVCVEGGGGRGISVKVWYGYMPASKLSANVVRLTIVLRPTCHTY